VKVPAKQALVKLAAKVLPSMQTGGIPLISVKPGATLIIFNLLLLGGCQYNPWANGFFTGRAADNDLVGTYLIDADQQKRTFRIGPSNSIFPINQSARIVLSGDHRAEFIGVPETMGWQPCSVNGFGSWRISKNDTFTTITAGVTNNDPSSPCNGEVGYELMLYGQKPPYKLHITIGDPDSGDAIQFEKQR
jgi:hypothetical protein